jgi:hypothetical protein
LSYQFTLPTGSTFRTGIAFGSGDTLLLPPLATSGTYAILLWPTLFAQRVSYQLALLPGAALTIDGAAQTVTNAVPGAGARLNFAGTAGDNLGLGVTGPASDPATAMSATVSVYKPDGSQLASVRCSADGTQCAANLANLPVAGNYSVIVRPTGDATGTLRVWLSRDVAGALATGTTMALALSRPGQNARLTFAGTAGQALRLSWSGVAIPGTTAFAYMYVYAPDGSTLTSASFASGAAGGINLPTLAVTGTYTIFVDPPVGTSMSINLTLATR